jgi:hypothetical protein
VAERRFPRYQVNQFMNVVTFWDDVPIRKVGGRCIVLGEGGLGAILADELYIGDVVRVEMPPVPAVYATVRYGAAGGYGFEFLYTSDGQRQAVNKLCSIHRLAADSRSVN